MSADTGQEKTEKATPRRVEQAREKGQVSKSQDLTASFILMGMVLFLFISGEGKMLELKAFYGDYFENISFKRDAMPDPRTALYLAVVFFLKFTSIIFILAAILAIVINIAQVGFLFTTKVFAPRPGTFNPVEGFKKIASVNSLVELVKSLFKFFIVGLVVWKAVSGNLDDLLQTFGLSSSLIAQQVLLFTLKVASAAAVTYFAVGLLDFAYQKYSYHKNLRMTKQQIKDEYKQTEGDPHLKARLRERQRQIALNQIAQEVPRATVVVTNPEHLAVALKYSHLDTPAPVVVAKGSGRLAQQIKKIAGDNNIPVIENKPVAQFLYKTTEVGNMIPEDLYQAVAEILALVYKVK